MISSSARVVQLVYVRDSIKAIPNCTTIAFVELQEKLQPLLHTQLDKATPFQKKVIQSISPARYAAMVLSVARGHTTWDDCD